MSGVTLLPSGPPSGPPSEPSPLLTRHGAVSAPDDPRLAWHYGDPLGEQRSATHGPVLFDGWTAGTVTVTGDDRLTWLHNLCSQHLEEFVDGSAAEALWLSARGHVEHWADVREVDGAVVLRTEPGAAAALAGFLEAMRFWSKVTVTEITADVASLTIAGPGAAEAVAKALDVTPPPAGRCAAIPDGPAAGGTVRTHPHSVEVTMPRAAFGPAAQALIDAGARPAGTWARTALRIAARRPRFGVDNDDRTIPNETPWLATAVHLHKGCYRGQETVAKIDNVGAPPRRLVLVHLDGSARDLPAPGEPVTTADGRTVGRLGSVAHHFEDGPIALALVKRTIGPDTAVRAGDVDAAIDPEDVPPPARGQTIDRKAFIDFRRR